MRLFTLALAAASLLGAQAAHAADINRKIIAEVDPIAPTSAGYDQARTGIVTSKYGFGADFNLAGVLSTGPEYWTGTFTQKGQASDTLRREDMFVGERQKLDAIRLRWMFTGWENPSSMRGWYVKAGYSYIRVNSRGNRYEEGSGAQGDAIPQSFVVGNPSDDTSLVTDIRHGVAVGFGERWLVWDQKLAITLGTSATANFKRTVSVDTKDANARKDYDDMIETLPDQKMSIRPLPEVNLGLGWAW
jgi:hypothetical protein